MFIKERVISLNVSKSYFLNFVLTSLFISFLFFSGLQNQLPDNPLQAFKSDTILKIFPQGWTFFSKSPRDQVTLILNQEGQSAVSWPNNSISNLFGISRDGRSQGIEMGLLSTQIPESNWLECKGDTTTCLSKNLETSHVDNPTPNPTLCGTYYMVNRQPVPWAWADLISKSEMPSKIAKVESTCSKM